MVSHSSSCKLVVLVILALQINLFATAFDGGDDVNIVLKSPHQAPSDQDMEEEPLSCHRLRMSIPRHLHPEALKSGRCAGIDNQGGIWSCPQDRQPKRSDFHFGLHCEDMELLFSLYSADEMAGLPQDIFGFDYQSWCKCPNNNNNVIDNNTNGNAHNSNNNLGCDLCTNGMILNQNVQDSIFNGETAADKRFQLTCAEAAEYARYITNEERII
ncbi:unnamed protein product [Cylindrotheca closterium]|uniref:Uncharacterized protein n=1 Tax=Cylindrotheca closterium TaxID=2856 RepID=A0AAD2JJ20_9STRA|nr:unnamed protein product [Cylindrotheca closterium]